MKYILRSHKYITSEVTREVIALTHLSHPHLLPIHLISDDTTIIGTDQIGVAFEQKAFSLDAVAGKCTTLQYKVLANQLVDVVSWLHSQNCIHMNITSKNILLDRITHLYLTNFTQILITNHESNNLLGYDPRYRAPELIFEVPPYHYSEKCDVWSLGLVLLELLVGTFPVEGIMDEEFFIISNMNWWKKYVNDENLKEVLNGMLQIDPHMRWTMENVRESAYFQNMKINGDFVSVKTIIDQIKQNIICGNSDCRWTAEPLIVNPEDVELCYEFIEKVMSNVQNETISSSTLLVKMLKSMHHA